MDLKQIRREIDWIDVQLLKLLRERLEMALRTRNFKQGIVDDEREQEVLRRARGFSGQLLAESYLEELFRRIIEESRALEERDYSFIAFQGEHGAYSEMAARQAFPGGVTVPLATFAEVFALVGSGTIDQAVVPLENSTEGAVAEVHDLLLENDLFIRAEILFPIHHQLLALPSCEPRDIQAVYSHPQALGQCRRFISRRKLSAQPFYDTAGAARWLMESRRRDAAVIAGSLCADLYGLEVLLADIEDEKVNRTRFLVLGKNALEQQNGPCKTSIVLSAPHRAGALLEVLQVFAAADLNLTRLESRPHKSDPGNYLFFLDFQGNSSDRQTAGVLERLREKVDYFKFLGSYREL